MCLNTRAGKNHEAFPRKPGARDYIFLQISLPDRLESASQMSTVSDLPEFIDVDGERIALRQVEGKSPGIVWLGGFKSDMLGTKAETLSEWAKANGHSFIRHDYSGHGESGGRFVDGTISLWLKQSLEVVRQRTSGPQ